MRKEQIEREVGKIRIINGIWLDRGGFWGATIEILGELAEIRFEAANFIWNKGGKDKITFVFKPEDKTVSILKSDFEGLNTLLQKLKAASSSKIYVEFTNSFK